MDRPSSYHGWMDVRGCIMPDGRTLVSGLDMNQSVSIEGKLCSGERTWKLAHASCFTHASRFSGFTVQRLHGRVGTGTGAQALTQRTLPGFSGYKMYTCFIRQGTTNQTNQPTTSPRFPPPFFSATIMYACDPFFFLKLVRVRTFSWEVHS